MRKHYLLMMLCALALFSCNQGKQESTSNEFIRVENGQFIRNGKPYYYVGANFWYGAILGSEGEGGNRERLHQELDFLKSIGVDNLRILVGADGDRGITAKVEPTLQIEPGVYNDTILAGLDYLMMEMGKRDMAAILYLNNSWEWSGGYSMYLQWAGKGKAPVPAVDGWPAYMEFVQQFVQCDSAKALFSNYVKDIITRENRFTGKKYIEDPTIMSWQIGNEPRAFSDENKEAFALWIADVAAQIRSLDPNHLISTGSEGKHGCEQDIDLFERIHADTNIDYLNLHMWPYNWGWVKEDSLSEGVAGAKEKAKAYLDEHLIIGAKYQKPVVMEEFGFPRDGFKFSKDTPTTARDEFYKYIFELISSDAQQKGLFAGCNFWAWGGFAELSDEHIYWEKGDDYTGDPAQEQQGLNSVFASDSSTIKIIKTVNKQMGN
ncbi:MAG: beta-mannosidase [Bacteroides sp.]|nr:beta-mannosidase [Bacteroides sp.]